jgi:hypothetical protein
MNLIVKPWMGCMATEAMIDYLAFAPDDRIERAAMTFCRWLLACRVRDERGLHWVYQLSHAGAPTSYKLDGTPFTLSMEGWWHMEYLAKILGWAAMRTNDPAYYEAWSQSYHIAGDHPVVGGGKDRPKFPDFELSDHGANKIVTNLSALRSRLWGAQLTARGVTIQPRTDLAGDLTTANISTPDGPQTVQANQKPPTHSGSMSK